MPNVLLMGQQAGTGMSLLLLLIDAVIIILTRKRRRPADRPTPPAKAPETLLDQKRVSDLTLEEYERLLFKNSVVGQLVLFFRGLLAFLFWIVAQVCMGLFLIFAVAAITDHEINAIVFWGMVFLFVTDCLCSYGVLRCSPSKGCTKVLGVLSGVALVLMYLVTFVALGLMLGSWWSATTWMLLILFGPALALLLLAFMVSSTSKLAKSG